ncbi:hypothetical protein [Metallosphaera javensis (ex Sakai et al. 2022)]|uniref:hypothetical protein n=1 Tax=Metallosphaera javensis (ex Sakai et al. 2022) TaxID=2775498 RepID=UPI002590CDFB|nr:MAG: hypothetical protein MjAS7_1294 [Metallosphaera javensis (ex Sakai et al. 2022)]
MKAQFSPTYENVIVSWDLEDLIERDGTKIRIIPLWKFLLKLETKEVLGLSLWRLRRRKTPS